MSCLITGYPLHAHSLPEGSITLQLHLSGVQTNTTLCPLCVHHRQQKVGPHNSRDVCSVLHHAGPLDEDQDGWNVVWTYFNFLASQCFEGVVITRLIVKEVTCTWLVLHSEDFYTWQLSAVLHVLYDLLHVEIATVLLIVVAVSWTAPAALYLDLGEAEGCCCFSLSLWTSSPSSRPLQLSVFLPWSWTSARGLDSLPPPCRTSSYSSLDTG